MGQTTTPATGGERLTAEQLDRIAAGFDVALDVKQLADGGWGVVHGNAVLFIYPNEGMAVAVAKYLNCPTCSPKPDFLQF